MKKTIELKIEVLQTEALSVEDKLLRDKAIQAAGRAYAPYSAFHVGAAILLEDGTIVTGNNQENVAYPSGLCAERVALFSAGASYPDVPVVSLALVALKYGRLQPSISPCGACRQVLLETERRYGSPVRILLCGYDQTVIVFSAHDLLPFGFSEM